MLGTPGKAPDEEELLRLVPGCAGWLAGVEKITEKVLRGARGLKAISRNGTGVDSIDLEACKRLGIAVLRADGANARGVAELTLALLLSLLRSVPCEQRAHEGRRMGAPPGSGARRKDPGGHRMREDRKAGGPLRAWRLDMEVLGYDAYPDACLRSLARFRFAALEELHFLLTMR